MICEKKIVNLFLAFCENALCDIGLRGKEIREREGETLPEQFYPQKGKHG
jgi:hypothetical protein